MKLSAFAKYAELNFALSRNTQYDVNLPTDLYCACSPNMPSKVKPSPIAEYKEQNYACSLNMLNKTVHI
jgi:hypothetical protein